MEGIQEFALIVFAIIGVVVTLIVTIIALIWLTCFMVRLLIKTFSYRVDVSVEVTKEDINNKAEAKKFRNKLKTDQKNAHKMTLLKMKLESSQRVFELKKDALASTLNEKENKEREKLGLERIERPKKEVSVSAKKEEPSIDEDSKKSKKESDKEETAEEK